ncbi:undecaprenyl-diphosphate phosphatase [Comamonas antarctica]|uniref:Undecaprenyl-diphosphatase n=1 Tax=Comamonas antarctica TaxID=2743470 RepID=A0A6N1X750_9BURK|nr:undecaprenyl-diphosphate phosphatase [Comamonas antarctica]QKV54678.1 undecaprenyl-diphosphate phosphatase [Comamonas antarctica]
MDQVFGWLDALLLGILQGVTEFLPISSSAHLRIFGPLLVSGADPGAAFTAITQLGTELAVLLYFRADIWRIASHWCRSLRGGAGVDAQAARLGWLVLLGTLPIALLGLLLKDFIEHSLRNLYLTAAMLIGFGLVLGWADRIGRRAREMSSLTVKHGILMGFAQALALIPGVSRSGGTITAGLLLGYTREAAVRYSFLLAIPAVLASGLYQLLRSWGQPGPVGAGPTLLATAVAFAVGYIAIAGFMRFISRQSFRPFVYYRIVLGVAVIVALQMGWLAPL